MSIEGRVMIDLGAGRGSPVRVDYRTPLRIAGLVRGKTPEAAARLFPLVYSICGNAQAHAAALALEAALAVESPPQTANARAIVTALENWRESLLRIVLDWPQMIGGKPDAAAARPALRLLEQIKPALFASADPFAPAAVAAPDRKTALSIIGEAEQLAGDLVLGEASEQFLARHGPAGLTEWAETRETPAARFVRDLARSGQLELAAIEAPALALPDDLADLRRWLGFAMGRRHDEHAGTVPETTLFARRSGELPVAGLRSRGLGARYAARLAELARLPLEMRELVIGDAKPAACSGLVGGHGVAVVEAARGLLAHAVRLEDGLVAGYGIAAPTDWNFHERGIAAKCLTMLGDREDRIEIAHLVVRAIDPCVAYEMRAG